MSAAVVAVGSSLMTFSRASSTRSLHWTLNPRVRHTVSAAALQLHTTGVTMHVKTEDFEKAKDQLQRLKNDPGNEVKLKLYALFKQATQGPCNVPKPGMMDFVNKAKWDAWKSLGDLSEDDAKETYVNLVSSLVSTEPTSKEKLVSASGKHEYETLEVVNEGNLTKIILNRPDKKNAINTKMYNEIIHSLEAAAKDESVVTVLTGKGDYYCSGNDLNNFAEGSVGNKEKMARDSAVLLEKFVNCFIDFPKPLIAIVNGPAIGVSVTILGIFDIVYATDRATFHTPFSQLGQSPEGCSSYTFPKIMGYSKANEMLLFNKKLTAKEACDQGLVTEVFPDSAFQKQVWGRVNSYAQLPRESLALSKQLIRGLEKEKLHSVNSQECERLIERWLSDECMNAILSFFQNKSRM